MMESTTSNTKEEYLKLLEKDYQNTIEFQMEDISKLEYLGSHVFGFTTYASDLDEEFATNMLEVLDCILYKNTFEYIESNRLNYHRMVNMPFLENCLSWGTSIRGAWFCVDLYYDSELDKYVPKSIRLDNPKVDLSDTESLKSFIGAVLDFAEFNT